MRLLFKTGYAQDTRLFPFGGTKRFRAGFALYAAIRVALAHWSPVALTGGNMGFVLSDPSILGYTFDSEQKMYYLALVLFGLTLLAGPMSVEADG